MPQVAMPQPRSKLVLSVFPNPYHCYDHLGRLSSAVRYDPLFGRPGEIHHVGAEVTTKVVEARGEVKSIPQDTGTGGPPRDVTTFSTDPRGDLRDTTVKHDVAAHPLPHTDYHVRMIRGGSLIAADEATAKAARVAFMPLREALIAARAKLVQAWKAEHPEDDVPEWPMPDQISGGAA